MIHAGREETCTVIVAAHCAALGGITSARRTPPVTIGTEEFKLTISKELGTATN
jgi:hypothetical protein